MSSEINFAGIDWWQTAGWTMIHFLWLGTAVALVAAAVRVILRRTSPNVRYLAALGNLLSLTALPVAIAVWLACHSPATQVGTIGGGSAVGGERSEARGQGPGLEMGGSADVVDLRGPAVTAPIVDAGGEGGVIELSNRAYAAGFAGANSQPAPRSLPENQTLNVTDSVKGGEEHTGGSSGALTSSNQNLEGRITALLHSAVAYSPWLWVSGTPLTFALLATGLVGTRRLERASQCIPSGPIVEACTRLAQSLRIGRQVTIAVCERIAAPVLVGIVRPMILLPPAAISGWSPEEIEMVLLHELAHVRRWDNLVNLLQRLVESLLFFHPAVWFSSNWVRREREACCDAIVVTQTQRPRAYAEMLISLAARMPRSALFPPAAASAMASGPLRSRIRQILKLEDDPMLVSGRSLLLATLVMLVLVPAAVMYLPVGSRAETAEDETIPQAEDVTLLIDPQASTAKSTSENAASQEKSPELSTSSENIESVSAEQPDKTESRPLADAVREFNEKAAGSSVGRRQPPLSEDEIVTAIKTRMRYQVVPPADADAYYAVYEKIAETRILPPGATLESTTDIVTETDRVFVWRVSIDYQATPNSGFSFQVRNEQIGSRPLTEREKQEFAKVKPALKPAPDQSKESATTADPKEIIFVTYDVPVELASYVRSWLQNADRSERPAAAKWSTDEKLLLQATRELHDRLRKNLASTAAWRKSLESQADGPPIVREITPAGPRLRWTVAGLVLGPMQRAVNRQRGLGERIEVVEVVPGSVAAWHNIQPGALLLSCEEFSVHNLDELQAAIENLIKEFTDIEQVRVRIADFTANSQLEISLPLHAATATAPQPSARGRGRTISGGDRGTSESAPGRGSRRASSRGRAARGRQSRGSDDQATEKRSVEFRGERIPLTTIDSERAAERVAHAASWLKPESFSSPEYFEFARQAWEKWGLVTVPATDFERSLPHGREIKIVSDADVPSAVGPPFLAGVGEVEINNFADLGSALSKIESPWVVVKAVSALNTGAFSTEYVQSRDVIPQQVPNSMKTLAVNSPSQRSPVSDNADPPAATATSPLPADPLELRLHLPQQDAAGLAEWEKLIAQTPRVDAEAARLAWEKMGLKLIPANDEELAKFRSTSPGELQPVIGRLKIVGGNLPPGLPIPAFIESIAGREDVFNFDTIWHYFSSSQETTYRVFARDIDQKRYVFNTQPPKAEPAVGPAIPATIPASSPAVTTYPTLYSPISAAAPNTPTDATPRNRLRFENRSFNEWRNAWRTELSAEKRLEAVKALAAFGANGYGKEAAEAILEVVKLYDWSTTSQGTPIALLKTEAVAAFAGKTDGSPAIVWQDWLPLLTQEVKTGNDRVVGFAATVFERYRIRSSDFPEFAGELIRLSGDESLGSTRLDVVRLLARILVRYEARSDKRIAARLTELLNDEDENVRIVAFSGLYDEFSITARNAERGQGGGGRRGFLGREAIAAAEYRPELLDLLRKGPRVDVIEVLGYLGERATPAVPELLNITLDENPDIALAAALAVGKITSSDEAVTRHLDHVIAAGEPAEHVERARAALEMLQQHREQQTSPSFGGGGRGVGGGGRSTGSGGRGGRGQAGRGGGRGGRGE